MEKNEFGGLEKIFIAKYIDEGVLYTVIDPYRISKEPYKCELSARQVIGTLCVVRGQVDIVINAIKIEGNARRNNLICIMPSDMVDSIAVSDDFKGYVVLLNSLFKQNDTYFVGMRPRTMPSALSLPYYTITEQERQLLVSDYNRIEQNFERETHRFHHQLIKLAVMETFCDTMEIICNNSPAITVERPTRGRREELLRRFMDLLAENVRNNHDVAYYADRLCITPQYLTKLAKYGLGHTAGKAIDMALMREATIMLRSTDMGIAEIAYHLSFADGASFSKFFRKHQGVSPAQYRKEL